MFILDDILHQIICPLLDLNSLINLHLTCKESKTLFEKKIHDIKPYYLNGIRYKNLEKLRLKYILLKMHKTKRKISCNFIIFN